MRAVTLSDTSVQKLLKKHFVASWVNLISLASALILPPNRPASMAANTRASADLIDRSSSKRR